MSLTLLLCGLANLSLVAYVFWKRHSRPVHVAFASLVLALSVWNFNNFAIILSSDLEIVSHLGRMAFALGALVATLYLFFTWLFPETCHPRPKRSVVIVVCCVALTVTGLCFTPYIQSGIDVTGPYGKRPVFGPLYPVFGLYFLVVFSWATANLFISRVRSPSGRERMQMNYTLTGFGLAFVMVSITQFILPFYALTPDFALVGGGLASLLVTLMTSYAVFRHRLLDIGIAFRTATIYSLMALILGFVFFVPLLLYPRFGGDDPTGLAPIAFSMVMALALAVIVAPLHQWITRAVDHRLFRGRYDHEAALLRLGSQLSATYGRESIAQLIAREIPIIMQADGSAVYLADSESGSLVLLGTSGSVAHRIHEHLSADDTLVCTAMEQGRPLLKDEISYDPRLDRETAETLALRFQELAFALAYPLSTKNRMLGVIFLGDKQKENAYTSDDLKLLGALVSQAAVALDNTRLYEEMLEAKKHYETILRHMQRGVLTVDMNLRIVTLNDMGATILDAKAAEWFGRDIAELVPAFADALRQTIASDVDQPPLELTVRRGGHHFPCECETSQLADARNRVTGALIVFQDLTERKRFEGEVRRMDRLASVGTLAAGMAHEIKNPLVAIQTFAQLLPERSDDPAFRDSFSAVVTSEVRRINDLVGSLLNFARPRQQKPRMITVSEVITGTLGLLDSELRKQAIEVVRDEGEGAPQVFADPEQLHQVFLNLFKNAADAMDGERRRLTVRLRHVGRSRNSTTGAAVLVTVQDTGRGIATEHLPRVFDPFYTTKENGSGLGLAICHGILRDHGGHIDVQSDVREGTVFTVTIPIRGAKSNPASASEG